MLARVSVVNASINLPADVAGWRLAELGATVTKIEPPGGDPLEHAAAGLYAELTRGQPVLKLDLKTAVAREALSALLDTADVLITSSRPSALARVGLAGADVATRHPQLAHIAIVGHPSPHQELAGHDLTYLARGGLLSPPAMPRTLAADLAGAERAVSTALALLIGRDSVGNARYAEVALETAAAVLSLPYRHGLTGEGGLLGGGTAYYALYETAAGWIALAALEQHFQERLLEALGLEDASGETLAAIFRDRSAVEWERWAIERDIPVARVR